MSIHYLLDGYNLIHQMPSALDQATLEDQRYHLVRFIEQSRPQGSLNNPVTIVFDGNIDIFGGMSSSSAKIVFSHGESADEKIKKIVAQAKNTKDIIVVTDDRAIQYAVRALGAKISGTQAFLGKAKGIKRSSEGKGSLKSKRGVAPNPLSENKKYIPRNDEAKITSEFSKIWLDPNGKKKK